MFTGRKWAVAVGLSLVLFAGVAPGGGQVWAAPANTAIGTPTAGYTATKYPIVLVHGMLGFDSILNGFIDYWYKIVPDLRAGGAQVYVAEVSGLNTSEERGEQLVRQIEYVLAATGAEKVNLIGHSHGGPTIRYAAAVMPDRVASATAVAGLNTRGQPLTGIATNFKGKPLGNVIKGGLEGLAKLIDFLSGKQNAPEDAFKSLEALSVEGMTAFNAKFPQGLPPADCKVLDGPELVDGVRYYSWTGNAIFTTYVDPLDYVFALTGPAMWLLDPEDRTANDGLISICASRLGRQLGVYRQNHLDEVNNFWGLVSPNDVSPVVIYREHANRLKKLGL
ncbi:MAG: triacylglycerol lipase [Sterolibacterium sp.]|nr:triacylglycerol lipase [Sterolibacterium sp.]